MKVSYKCTCLKKKSSAHHRRVGPRLEGMSMRVTLILSDLACSDATPIGGLTQLQKALRWNMTSGAPCASFACLCDLHRPQ